MLSPRMTAIVITVVTVIWATNFIAGVIMKTYEADQMINTIFMAIVGGAIALRRKDDPPKDGGRTAAKESVDD